MPGDGAGAPEAGGAPLRVEACALTDPRWEAYARSAPEATFFHRSGWLKVVAEVFSYPPQPLLALRGEEVTGVLPLFLVRHLPFGHSLISTPMAVYGGVRARDEASARALLERARALAAERGARYLELRDGVRFPELPAKDLYVTFRREIDPDPEVNMARIPRNQRRSIRVAQKHGLTHRFGGAELLPDFYRIYSHSVHHLGTPVFPRALFEGLMRAFAGECGILGVHHEGRMVAGVLTFFHRDEVLPYFGGAYREAFPLAANDYMYWCLMGEAAARGCRVFDFGRSKRDSGSYHFKRHWGFEPTPLAYQYHLVRAKGIPDLSPRNPRFSLPIRVWKRLPLPVAEWLGPRVVRYFP